MKADPLRRRTSATSFGYAGALRVWAFFLGVLAVVLYAWWPRSSLAWHLRAAAPPQTFAAVSVVLFSLAGYLNARWGAGEYAPAGEGRSPTSSHSPPCAWPWSSRGAWPPAPSPCCSSSPLAFPSWSPPSG